MAVLAIEHSDTCTTAMVGQWLADAGIELHRVRGHRGERLPTDLSAHQGLLVMGGPMNAYDDDAHPWLPQTRTLLRQAVHTGLPTLGICLGHQLLAVACGGEVTAMASGKQLGPYAVGLTPAGRRDVLLGALGEQGPDVRVIHWNGDIVSTPPAESEVLATTPAGIQALRVGDHAWGVQFHPEVGLAQVRVWADRDIADGKLAADRADRLLTEVAQLDTRLTTTIRPLADRFATMIN